MQGPAIHLLIPGARNTLLQPQGRPGPDLPWARLWGAAAGLGLGTQGQILLQRQSGRKSTDRPGPWRDTPQPRDYAGRGGLQGPERLGQAGRRCLQHPGVRGAKNSRGLAPKTHPTWPRGRWWDRNRQPDPRGVGTWSPVASWEGTEEGLSRGPELQAE